MSTQKVKWFKINGTHLAIILFKSPKSIATVRKTEIISLDTSEGV